MRRIVYAILATSLTLNVLSAVLPKYNPPSSPENKLPVCVGRATVHFSPKGGCEQAIVKLIGNAKRTIYVNAYSFTSEPIAKALIEAHNRSVYIEVVVDGKQQHHMYCKARMLLAAGLNVWTDEAHGLAHNKTILIDEHLVTTGSYNFSDSAEHDNAENLLVLDCPDLYGQYFANFKIHREHAKDLREVVAVPIPEAELVTEF